MPKKAMKASAAFELSLVCGHSQTVTYSVTLHATYHRYTASGLPPDTASGEDIRRFQLHLAESGVSICHLNRTMTGLRFLFRVTLRRPDLATDTYHIKEPQLCGVRHKIGYADRRTMPNGHVFPRIRGDWHMTDSA
jgi:hypothetical protein